MFLKQSQGNPSPSPSLVFQTYKGGEGGPSDSSLAHEGREWCPLLSVTFKWGRLEEQEGKEAVNGCLGRQV